MDQKTRLIRSKSSVLGKKVPLLADFGGTQKTFGGYPSSPHYRKIHQTVFETCPLSSQRKFQELHNFNMIWQPGTLSVSAIGVVHMLRIKDSQRGLFQCFKGAVFPIYYNITWGVSLVHPSWLGWGNYNVLRQFGAQTHQFPISEASEFPLMAAPHREFPLKELTKPAGVSRGKT